LNRNNRNKRLVSDSFETSFGSSFGCFESKLVSQDTLSNGIHAQSRLSKYFSLTDLSHEILVSFFISLNIYEVQVYFQF
jgi:hypothetical protein